MERYKIILFFAILSFAGWDMNSLSIRRIIKRVGIRIKFYPAHYIMPSRKMRKIFKLDKKEIPKWMYFSLYLSFVYIILFLIFVLYVLIDDELTILQVFLYGYGILIVANIWRFLLSCIKSDSCNYIYRWTVGAVRGWIMLE